VKKRNHLIRLDPTTILLSAALIGLGALIGHLADRAVDDRASEPKHRSFAQCIVDESRGLTNDVAAVAIVACRELFPNGTLRLPASETPKADLPNDMIAPEKK